MRAGAGHVAERSSALMRLLCVCAAVQQMEGLLGATTERLADSPWLVSMMFCSVCDVARHVPAFAGGRLSNDLGPLQTILVAYICVYRQTEAEYLLPMMDYQYGRALKACLPQVLAPSHAVLQEPGHHTVPQPALHCALCAAGPFTERREATCGVCMQQVMSRLRSIAGTIERFERVLGAEVDWRDGRVHPRYEAFEQLHRKEPRLKLCLHL